MAKKKRALEGDPGIKGKRTVCESQGRLPLHVTFDLTQGGWSFAF